MPAATLPKKRVFGEASSARRNIVATPVSAKKRRLDEPSSSPAPRFTSSQNNGKGKLASSQPKSAFESEVLERMSQDISDLKQTNAEKDQVWDRPPVPRDYDPDTDSLSFQAIEAEEGTVAGGQTAVKLFGVTSHGNSVLLHVKDFKHYLYVAAPVSFTAEDCPKYRAYLETQVAMHQTAIDSVTMTMRENIYGFQGNIQNPYLKVTVTDPKFINKVRSTIEGGKANWKGMWKSADGTVMTYDNIQYLLRFMVDCSVCFLICR
jgi:DNA polymerase delta subunit 1